MSTLIKFRSKNRSTLSRFDLTLNLAVAALLAIGTLLVYAATREWFRSNNLDPEYYLKRHILNILIGALLAYGTTLIDYRLLRAYAPILWLISIIGLIAVFIPGIGEEVNQIERTVMNIKEIYDKEVKSSAEFVISSVKPMITIFMGSLIGWMAVAIFSPIYTSISAISKT